MKIPLLILAQFLAIGTVLAAEPINIRYGFAPDRVGLSASGWLADNQGGHATDHEDQYDYSRISIGLRDNFIRSYLWHIEDKPGVRAPGRVTFRLRRLGDSSKIILQADGVSVCTYLNKDPDADRYIITGGTNEEPVYWGSRDELKQWHDYTLEYDGTTRSFIIDDDPATRIELALGKTPHGDHLSLGMGYEYGKDMYIDVESLRFTPAGSDVPAATPSARIDGAFTGTHPDGARRLACQFVDGKLSGAMTRWYPDGQKASTGTYADDERHGEWLYWYPDGQERLRVTYTHGQPDGQYLRYYPGGNLETVVRYRAGIANGLFLRWFPDGTPQFSGGYRDGLMDGFWAKWAPDGTMLWSHLALAGKKDVFLKTWYPDGTEKQVAYYERAQMHGSYVEYHPNGRARLRGQYRHGQKVGDWYRYDEAGTVISHDTFPDSSTDDEP